MTDANEIAAIDEMVAAARVAQDAYEAKGSQALFDSASVSYTHLRAHETKANLVCRLLL